MIEFLLLFGYAVLLIASMIGFGVAMTAGLYLPAGICLITAVGLAAWPWVSD